MEVVGSGGGGTEKRARSWGSVSRIRVVMSGVERRALVKILGGGKLGGVSWFWGGVEGEGRTGALKLHRMRVGFVRGGGGGGTF